MSRTTKVFTIARALKSDSEYAKQMKYLSASIFGEVKRPTDPESLKMVQRWSRKPYEDRKEIVEYYPPHDEIGKLMRHLRKYGLFRDEHLDFKEEMERLRTLRGKPTKVFPRKVPIEE